ncbi:MAG: ferrous iron transport protein A [Solobacterium sp.]|nr:ferrous iron transport protein A [Solobacterium sp.]
MKLSEMKAGTTAMVKSLGSDRRFVSRITAIGMSEGASFEVVKNDRKMPVLIYVR